RAQLVYVNILVGQGVKETDRGVLVNVSGMLVALNGNDSSTDHFDPFRVGLDHLALAVEDPGILEDLKRDLDAAGVRNNGVEVDPKSHVKYISFYDPDGIAWELYSISTRSEV